MSKDYGCAACLSSSANNYPHTYDNDCLGRLPDNQGITPKHLRNLRNVTGQPACGCSNCNATTGVTDLELNGIKVGTVVRSNPLHQFHKPSNLGYCPKRNPPLSAPTNTDELDEILRKLEERIEYNRHDMGEMGMFIRVGYVKNFLKDSKPEIARLIALKQREELEDARTNHAIHSYSETDESLRENRKMEEYFGKRHAELNTIIEGEK